MTTGKKHECHLCSKSLKQIKNILCLKKYLFNYLIRLRNVNILKMNELKILYYNIIILIFERNF